MKNLLRLKENLLKAIPYFIILVLTGPFAKAADEIDPPAPPAPITDPYNHALNLLNFQSNGHILDVRSLLVSPTEFIAYIYNIIFPIGIAFGIFGIIMAGYTFLSSEGHPEKIKDASNQLSSAIIGLLFIILSIVILRLIVKGLINPAL